MRLREEQIKRDEMAQRRLRTFLWFDGDLIMERNASWDKVLYHNLSHDVIFKLSNISATLEEKPCKLQFEK